MTFPVESLNSFTTWLFTTSLKAIVVIAGIQILRTLLRHKISAQILHGLWLLLIVRLLLPFDVPSPASMFNVTTSFTANQPVEPVPISPKLGSLPEHSNMITPAPLQLENKQTAPKTNFQRKINFRDIAWSDVIGIFWLTGVVLFLTTVFVQNYRFRKTIRSAAILPDSRIINILRSTLTRLNIQSHINAYPSSGITTPLLMGVFKPTMLLPQHLVESLSDSQLQHVFLHELAHVKRRDLPLAWLCTFLQALHWFNPFIWLAFYLMRGDREAACDEMALKHLGQHNAEAYGETLLLVMRKILRKGLLPVTLSLSDNHSNLKRRITMIATFSKKSRWWNVVAVLLFACLAGLALTGATPSLNHESLYIRLGANRLATLNGMELDVDDIGNTLHTEYDVSENTNVSVETSAETPAAAVYDVMRQLLDYKIVQVQFKNRESGQFISTTLHDEADRIKSMGRNLKYLQKNGKWGYVEEEGHMVIPALYEDAYPTFINGYASVKKNGAWGLIDTLNQTIVPFRYDKIGHLEEGRIAFLKDGKWGFLDAAGIEVIPAQFEQVRFFYNGYAPVQMN